MAAKPKEPKAGPAEESCAGCAHWKEQRPATNGPRGECRRWPPSVKLPGGEGLWTWPRTASSYPACGEFKKA